MENYEISSATLAIVPLGDEVSKVYEEEYEYIVQKSANSIIKDNCEFYGSSYEGRCIGTKTLTGIKTKFPIIIEESRNIIFFPTSSTRTKQSTWIALNKIKEISKKAHQNSEILFKNQDRLDLDISINSLENQIVRATMLKSKLYERKLEEKN
ncbi:MAG: competence protein ComK [Bacilli bacterium]|nr:competence protein ComK [Bacilli bacterium]